jgi:uncharacterized protein (TIGR02611 family)
MHAQVLRLGKRICIGVAGGAVMLVGLVLSLPLVPGPGLAIMLLGLAILSLEFEKPRLWLAQLRAWGRQLRERLAAWMVRVQARVRHLRERVRTRRSSRRDG